MIGRNCNQRRIGRPQNRLQFGNKFEHPLYERNYPHKAVELPVTGVIPRTFAPPFKPLPGTPQDKVAFYERYMEAKSKWEKPGQQQRAPAETAKQSVFH